MAGLLVVKPLSAKLTRDTEIFAKMDPYCVVRLGQQTQKTAIAKKAGKLPFWRDQLVFRKKCEEEVVFQVWDSDSATADDLVGEAKLMLREVTRHPHEGWLKLEYRGRSAGKLRISIEFRPELSRSGPSLEEDKLDNSCEEQKQPARAAVPSTPPHTPTPSPPHIPTLSKSGRYPQTRSIQVQTDFPENMQSLRTTIEVAVQTSVDNSNYRVTVPPVYLKNPHFNAKRCNSNC